MEHTKGLSLTKNKGMRSMEASYTTDPVSSLKKFRRVYCVYEELMSIVFERDCLVVICVLRARCYHFIIYLTLLSDFYSTIRVRYNSLSLSKSFKKPF